MHLFLWLFSVCSFWNIVNKDKQEKEEELEWQSVRLATSFVQCSVISLLFDMLIWQTCVSPVKRVKISHPRFNIHYFKRMSSVVCKRRVNDNDLFYSSPWGLTETWGLILTMCGHGCDWISRLEDVRAWLGYSRMAKFVSMPFPLYFG